MNVHSIQFNTDIWREGDMYVSYVPQLDISSCGKTIEEAKKNIYDAVEGFIEEAANMGTVQQIMDEAGFVFENGWKAPEYVGVEKMMLAL